MSNPTLQLARDHVELLRRNVERMQEIKDSDKRIVENLIKQVCPIRVGDRAHATFPDWSRRKPTDITVDRITVDWTPERPDRIVFRCSGLVIRKDGSQGLSRESAVVVVDL